MSTPNTTLGLRHTNRDSKCRSLTHRSVYFNPPARSRSISLPGRRDIRDERVLGMLDELDKYMDDNTKGKTDATRPAVTMHICGGKDLKQSNNTSNAQTEVLVGEI